MIMETNNKDVTLCSKFDNKLLSSIIGSQGKINVFLTSINKSIMIEIA